jgi:hypothetical protein
MNVWEKGCNGIVFAVGVNGSGREALAAIKLEISGNTGANGFLGQVGEWMTGQKMNTAGRRVGEREPKHVEDVETERDMIVSGKKSD